VVLNFACGKIVNFRLFVYITISKIII